MLKQKIKNTIKIRKISVGIVSASLVVAIGLSGVAQVRADEFERKIQALNEQNNQTEASISNLESQAQDLETTIKKLQSRINGLQNQINDNRSKIAELEARIDKAQAELDEQRGLLGQNIRQMYLEGQITTLEMLASSRDLGEFVEREQYRNSVKNQITETLDTITALKQELAGKRDEVDSRLKEQEQLQASLASERSQNSRLLSLNEGERSDLDSKIKKNNKKIEELRRQQVLENLRLFGGAGGGVIGGGGYPWGNAKCLHTGQVGGLCPNYDWAVGGSVWNFQTGGYGYRNCTDWVAYRVMSRGGHVPAALGNANSWDDNAPSYGYTVSNKPKAGAAAVSNAGYYGHVMYVESVNGDGTITISDYNRAGTGKYDVANISPNGLRFVYF
jgi:peptidoglycan hydrolase CwlO-like protein